MGKRVSLSLSDRFLERVERLGVSPKSLLEGFVWGFEFKPLVFREALEKRKGDVGRAFFDLFAAADFGWFFIKEIKDVLGIDGFILNDFEVSAEEYGVRFILNFGAAVDSKLAFDEVYIEVGDGVRVVYSKHLELNKRALERLKKAIDEVRESGDLDSIYEEADFALTDEEDYQVLELSVICDGLNPPDISEVDALFRKVSRFLR